MKPHHLGHVHLKVSDLKRAEEFYTNMLGLKVTERVGDEFIFMTLGTHHHDVALMNVGKNAPRPPARGTGLFHFAFEVATTKDFAAFYKRLNSESGQADMKSLPSIFFFKKVQVIHMKCIKVTKKKIDKFLYLED